MVKFKVYVNKDDETAYLNKMAEKGYAMTGFCMGFYFFDSCLPGEYIYQVDITEGLFRVSNDYREFMREMGVEIICLWGPWVILRKKAADGPFVLYTDVESSIEHYEKIKKTFKIAILLEIVCILMEIVSAANGTDRASVVTPLAFCCLLSVFVLVLFREISRVNMILTELRERIGQETTGGAWKKTGKPSGLLCMGLFLNGISILLPETGGNALYGVVKGMVIGLALFLMGAGLVITLLGQRR